MLRSEPAAIQIGGVGVCTVRTEIAVGGNLQALALVREDLLPQAFQDDLEVFREHFRGGIDLDAKALELELLIARTNAELEPAVADDIREADLREQALRLIERQHADGRAEPDPAGDAREMCDHHHR